MGEVRVVEPQGRACLLSTLVSSNHLLTMRAKKWVVKCVRRSVLNGARGWSGPVSGGLRHPWCLVPGGSDLILPADAWLNNEVRSHQINDKKKK